MVIPPAMIVLVIVLIIAVRLAYMFRPSRRSVSHPVAYPNLDDFAEDFYHLMNYNGLPMTRATAREVMNDPANAEALAMARQASPADRARWREHISLVDHRWIDDTGG